MKTKMEELFELVDQAWDQYEFNSGVGTTQEVYDAVRHAFIQGYILAYTKEKPCVSAD